jgi:hypothetical protein
MNNTTTTPNITHSQLNGVFDRAYWYLMDRIQDSGDAESLDPDDQDNQPRNGNNNATLTYSPEYDQLAYLHRTILTFNTGLRLLESRKQAIKESADECEEAIQSLWDGLYHNVMERLGPRRATRLLRIVLAQADPQTTGPLITQDQHASHGKTGTPDTSTTQPSPSRPWDGQLGTNQPILWPGCSVSILNLDFAIPSTNQECRCRNGTSLKIPTSTHT